MRVLLALATLTLLPVSVSAQPAAGRVEIAGGVQFAARETFPAVASTQVRLGGATRDVFHTETAIDPFPAVDARVGVALTSWLQIEGAAAIGWTDITTDVSRDVEGVADTSVAVPLVHYGFEGGVVARMRNWASGRMTPLVVAGAGYFRQVQDGGVVVDSGRSYHVGAGVDYRWRTTPQARVRAAGLRADLRLLVHQGGLSDQDDVRMLPVAGAWLYLRF